MKITIFHNKNCGTSRNVLATIKAAGYEPEVVDYMTDGWSREQLFDLFSAAGISAKDALRVFKTQAKDLGLTCDDVTDDALLDAMVADPVLVNRPLVVTPTGTKLCRPAGAVLDLLPNWPSAPFAKENGALMIDADGKPVDGA